ncbi:hypothetical protein TrVE_jg2856 [Triparma verrucosa]|uniref:Uncharacterized protein n=1 Tax=Triparma verrucosa TaxID=1606542 RepID=A0A9W7EVK3_9STRA|nr:hypothetical protein TrVE_jg2856 [Triparma verrucosa]
MSTAPAHASSAASKKSKKDKKRKSQAPATTKNDSSSSSAPQEGSSREPSSASPLLSTSNPIDDMFATKKTETKRKKEQEEETKKKKRRENGMGKKVKLNGDRTDIETLSDQKTWVDDGLGGIFNSEGFTGRRDKDGQKIFKAHLFNKKGFGTSNLCPFDCDCCYI